MYFPTPPMKDITIEMLRPADDLNIEIQKIIFESGIESKEIRDIEIDILLFFFQAL